VGVDGEGVRGRGDLSGGGVAVEFVGDVRAGLGVVGRSRLLDHVNYSFRSERRATSLRQTCTSERQLPGH
jgi:hypothetical protein